MYIWLTDKLEVLIITVIAALKIIRWQYKWENQRQILLYVNIVTFIAVVLLLQNKNVKAN